MLECADGTLYTGWTRDVERRLSIHNAGRGSRYTRMRLPVRVVYAEAHQSEGAARQRETALKRLRRAQKLALIAAYQASSTEDPTR